MKRWTGLLAIIVLVLLVLTTAVLAATAWGSMLRVGHMGSDALVAHMAASGVFVMLVPIAAVIVPRWAANRGVKATAKRGTTATYQSGSSTGLAGVVFWLWLAASWITMATMLASMARNLGTIGLLTMLSAHRWAGAATVITLLLMIVVGIVTRRSRQVPAE